MIPHPESPCLNCPDRCPEPNCHMTCEKYIKFDKECERIRQERYRIAEENRIQEEIIKRRIGLVANGGFYRKSKGE